MWCSGSNQATCSGPPAGLDLNVSSCTDVNRTKAFILCMSRRTACAMCSAHTRSASSGSCRSPGSCTSRHSRRYRRPKRLGSRCKITRWQSGKNSGGTWTAGASPASAVVTSTTVLRSCANRSCTGVLLLCQLTCSGATCCASSWRAARRKPARSTGPHSITDCMRSASCGSAAMNRSSVRKSITLVAKACWAR